LSFQAWRASGRCPIARRAQDPLAELVKIDPKSIGVGMYQHDVDQKQLADTLSGVVESVVNSVGVDVNTASPALLTYVAGIGPKLAERVVAYRDENGGFPSRQALRQVLGWIPKAFEQAGGFGSAGWRKSTGRQLDPPESYPAAAAVLKKPGSLHRRRPSSASRRWKPCCSANLEKLAGEAGDGVPTLPIFSSSSCGRAATRARTCPRRSCAATCSRWRT
jgi:uncharacterized protein